MRTTVLAIALAAGAAVTAGLYSGTALADTRIRVSVDLGDILFASGHSYYRHDRTPVYVEYDRWGNRQYYRYADQRAYYRNYYGNGPRVVVVRGGPPAWGARSNGHWRNDRYYRYDRYDRDYRDDRRRDHDGHRDHDRDRDDGWHRR